MSWGIAAQPDMNATDMNVKTADNRFIIVSPFMIPMIAQTATKLKNPIYYFLPQGLPNLNRGMRYDNLSAES
jgi:hypothetical protein